MSEVYMFSFCMHRLFFWVLSFPTTGKSICVRTGGSKLPLGVSVGVNVSLVFLSVDPGRTGDPVRVFSPKARWLLG